MIIDSREKRLMRMDELMKFNTGTLRLVQEKMRELLNQDLRKLTTIIDYDQKVWLGLVAHYLDRGIWKFME